MAATQTLTLTLTLAEAHLNMRPIAPATTASTPKDQFQFYLVALNFYNPPRSPPPPRSESHLRFTFPSRQNDLQKYEKCDIFIFLLGLVDFIYLSF